MLTLFTMSNTDNIRQERRHEATRREIQEAAWAQIAQTGASALSLRAVATSINLSAPALYRYFPSKNALVTALILEAYQSLADAHDLVLTATQAHPWPDQLMELGLAYRQWALDRPAGFSLIFGDPIPGYEAPLEEVMPVAGRSLVPLITVLTRAHLEGALKLPLFPPPSQALEASLKAWCEAAHPVHPDLLYLAFSIASRVQGLMVLELGRQLPPYFADGKDLFHRELVRMVLETGGTPRSLL